MKAESISKYIVWDLISPYDGYWQTHCNTIDEVKEAIKKSSNLTEKEKSLLIHGSADRIQKIEKATILKDVFVTSGPLKIPQPPTDWD